MTCYLLDVLRDAARRLGSGVWLLPWCVIAALACGLAGCVTTRPWEREDLAKPVMALDPLPSRGALRGHLLGVQEGVIGGSGSGGGGCGCN